MKYCALSIIALAATAVAAPSEVEARKSLGKCNASQKQVCCTPILDIPLLSICLIQIAGSSCKSEAYCCQADQVNGLVVSLGMLHFGVP